VEYGAYNNQGFKIQLIVKITILNHHLSNLLSENVHMCILNSNKNPEQTIQGQPRANASISPNSSTRLCSYIYQSDNAHSVLVSDGLSITTTENGCHVR
jgi:hypothetical protein